MLKIIPLKTIVTYFVLSVAFLFIFLDFYHIDISLWHHNNQPVYFHNHTFRSFFQEPGKPAELISSFIGQYLNDNLIGSLLLTLLMAVWVISIQFVFRAFGSINKSLSLIMLSCIPFLIAFCSYNFPLAISISFVLAALLTAFIVPLISNLSIYFTVFLYFILSILIYILSGSCGIILFISISAGYYLSKKKIVHLLLLIIPVVIPMISLFFFPNNSFLEAYWGNFLLGRYNYAPLVIKLLPAIVLIIALSLFFIRRIKKNISWYYFVITHVTIIVIALSLVYSKSYNEKQKTKILINKLAYEEEWAKLLKTVKNIDLTKEQEVQFQVNRALYHQGMFLEKMFNYPQYYGVDGLFLTKITTGAITIPTSDIYYDLSFCNGSRHWANEAFNIFGPQPRILKRMISCYIATGQFELALKYLNLLELSDQHRDWAQNIRKYITCESCLNNSTEFSSLLKYKNFPDFFEATNYPRANLDYLVTGELNNRMAVEYIVAYDMLQQDLGKFIANIGKLKDIGYKKLPRSVQEAILLYVLKSKNFKINLYGFSVDDDVQLDFQKFNKVFATTKGNKMKAKSMLDNYTNTYWYYVLYNSPITNGREIKSKNIDTKLY